jgi:hypothetical protein
MNDRLDPSVARLLRHERARIDPSASSKARVLVRVRATLTGVPPVPPGEAPPRSAVVQFAGVARAAWLGLLLAGGATAFFATRAAWRPAGATAARRAAEIAAALTPAPRAPGSVVSAPQPPSAAVGDVPARHARDAPSAPASAALVSGASDLAAERLLLDSARTELLHGNPEGALVFVAEHARRFPHGVLSEERDALDVEVLVQAARYDAARRAAAKFHAAHRGSLLTSAVDSAVDAIP